MPQKRPHVNANRYAITAQPKHTCNVPYQANQLNTLHLPVTRRFHRSSDQLSGVRWDQADC
jgi:hypothetical protein